ncbi:hypothetical protein DUI70_0824 [Streptomyces albus]|nr:hypothetical protein DUI70_0824 [Streptomyces albus]
MLHTSTAITHHNARSGSPSQFGRSATPNASNAPLIAP